MSGAEFRREMYLVVNCVPVMWLAVVAFLTIPCSSRAIAAERGFTLQEAKLSPVGTCLVEGAKFVGTQPILIEKTTKPPKKLRDVKPAYPDLPTRTSGSGMWVGEVLLGVDGKVAQIWTVREIQFTPRVPAFNAAIVDAVRQWEYEPVVIGSKRTPVCLTATAAVDWR